jgi:LPXTG-site transpeptidase (sortase) family protein
LVNRYKKLQSFLPFIALCSKGPTLVGLLLQGNKFKKMQVKKILKWSLFIIAIITVIFFVIRIYFPNLGITSSQVSYTEPIPIPPVISQALQNLIDAQSARSKIATSSEQTNVGLPVRLVIPKINVDAAFEYLGLTPSGAMDVPKGPDNVAWFNLGPRPGEIGSSVVAGHYGWKNNIPAVFDNLYKLGKGDKMYIVDDKGATTTFMVGEIGIYDQNGDASNVFGSNDGKAHLNLITCEGVWNVVSKSRPSRLVIFTDKE